MRWPSFRSTARRASPRDGSSPFEAVADEPAGRGSWEVEAAVMLPAKTGPALARWLAGKLPPPRSQWTDWAGAGQVRIDARGADRAACGRLRDIGEPEAHWAAWRRGDREAEDLARRWLQLARYQAQAMAAVRHAQAKRALTLGRPVERTAGEVEFAEAYQIDMDRIAAVMERHLGRGATLPD